jgi:hypothetical protein
LSSIEAALGTPGIDLFGSGGPVATPVMTALPPMVSGGAEAFGYALGKWALRYPILAGAIRVWRGRGIPITVEKLWTLLRKYGPAFLVTAGILSLEGVSQLMMYKATHKRRRMNVLNPHALRRSTRRLLGFERRASRVAQALSCITPMRRRSRHRCAKCHRSPCVCP